MPVIQRAAGAGEIPLAGSPEWASLPPADIRRFAAVARAALAWLADSTDEAIAERLRDEMEIADLLARHAVAGASRDVAGAFAELRPNAAAMVPFDELQRRRDEMLGRGSDFDNAEHAGAAEMRDRLTERADRLGIVDLDVRYPGWNVRAGIRAGGRRLEGEALRAEAAPVATLPGTGGDES